MEYVLFIVAVIVVGIFIFPTSNGKSGYSNLFSRTTQPENCTCKNWGQFSFTVDYNCPIHGDWR